MREGSLHKTNIVSLRLCEQKETSSHGDALASTVLDDSYLKVQKKEQSPGNHVIAGIGATGPRNRREICEEGTKFRKPLIQSARGKLLKFLKKERTPENHAIAEIVEIDARYASKFFGR